MAKRQYKAPSKVSASSASRQKDHHIPVLLKEAVEGMALKPDGVYVDCTFGGGGHSNAILSSLSPQGKLIVFDQDLEAKLRVPPDGRVVFIAHNFRHIQRFLRLHEVSTVDGILADLGVSSQQFDQPERGFSTRFDADLDMRMDSRQELAAFDVVNTYSEERLHKIFEQYGEITNAKTLARRIVQARSQVSLQRISSFKLAIQDVVKGNPHRYFAQVFQALRIEVNDELGALRELLEQVPSLLRAGGRLVIITFHSLEDRLVKNFLRSGTFGQTQDDPFTQKNESKIFKLITKKPIVPSSAERQINPRSRSAKLRIAERI